MPEFQTLCPAVCEQDTYINIYIGGIVLTLVLIVIRLAVRNSKNRLLKHLFTAFIILFFFTVGVGGLYDTCTSCMSAKPGIKTKIFPTELIPFIDPDSSKDYVYAN